MKQISPGHVEIRKFTPMKLLRKIWNFALRFNRWFNTNMAWYFENGHKSEYRRLHDNS